MSYGGMPGGGYGPPTNYAMRPPSYGQPPPPMQPGGPFGYGYPTSLGSGYSYAPYAQPMQQQMPMQMMGGGAYGMRSASGLYSSYNSSLYSTPRRNSDIYSSTSSLNVASGAIKRATQPMNKPSRPASSSGSVSVEQPKQSAPRPASPFQYMAAPQPTGYYGMSYSVQPSPANSPPQHMQQSYASPAKQPPRE
eukprot:CAMPEP_0173380964 /NCGR_PEP_ID=MMETSP1356-20130122/3500_1 /TAXON_ID=77927 ORGANISM="Hemiselmis virescens, Strain PCC157" /NCGR_SAMPLE_ID=MMETSP1356 /ASSEMBLY_ACC=CAM_ASM_000847 /LENGTH=192 /DNA_ID=CAMNT_0014334689 /DNA_START=223 /DNA_END=798 /DNA_ORIENTATION=-